MRKGNGNPKKRGTTQNKRREMNVPCEIEMDLSGAFARQNTLKSKLGDTKEAHFGGFRRLQIERGCKTLWSITGL